jgi:hypothetical protein
LAKISEVIAALDGAEREKSDALDAVTRASQVATTKTAAYDQQKQVTIRDLQAVGPTVIGTTLYVASGDGQDVHKTTVNLGDAEVPDGGPAPTLPSSTGSGSPTTSPSPTSPSDGGIASPLTAGETAAP